MKFIKAIFVSVCAAAAGLLCACNSETTAYQEAPPFRSTAPYNYCIRDINGDFIAYVDTTQLITSNIERFFGKVVVLRGSLMKIDGEPVVRAENLKLK